MPIHDWTRVSAGILHHFHGAWLNHLSEALNGGLLPPPYYALAEQQAGRDKPAVITLEATEAKEGGPEAGGGLSAVAVAPPRVRFTATLDAAGYAARRRTLAIRHASGDRVVALVEVLSPGNKSSRDALRSFVRKAVRALSHGVHMLLVDLHPPGPRDPQGVHVVLWERLGGAVEAWPPDKQLTLAAYAAEGEGAATAYVEPVAVGDVLTEMPLFLTPDAYVPTPLEATYQAAYRGVPQRWKRVIEGAPS
jgi:hypothetical protein